tara:strand:- start:564 stop:737 length:174 start_codon:yes stop_codon:yes gene_type:complete
LNKPSTFLLQMIVSIRNRLEEISKEKTISYEEFQRLELLDRLFTSSLFYLLIDEVVE